MPTGLGGEIVWISPTLSLTNSADDLSGNGNNGTVVDASVVADSSNGGTHAYDFQAETHRIEIGRPAEVVASNSDFTISAWVYPTTSGNARTIWGGYKSLSSHELWSLLRIDSGNLKYWYADTNGAYRSATGPSISLNSWSHIAVTIDSSRVIKFFVNGTQQGANQTLLGLSSAPASSVEWWIGQSQAGLVNSPVENFDGKIDDFRWINRVIGQSEITHLATSRGIEGSPYTYSGLGDEKLWLCPSLDDSPDDISGNGNHGTYNGGMGTVADTDAGGTRAYDFTGTSKRIALGTSLNSAFYGDHSYSAWVRFSGNIFNA